MLVHGQKIPLAGLPRFAQAPAQQSRVSHHGWACFHTLWSPVVYLTRHDAEYKIRFLPQQVFD